MDNAPRLAQFKSDRGKNQCKDNINIISYDILSVENNYLKNKIRPNRASVCR